MIIDLVNPDLVLAAAAAIAPYVERSPIVAMVPSGVLIKAESLQRTGAFKIRGAFNSLLSLARDDTRQGVVASSSGNHAQALAYAAKTLGIKAVLVMPETVVRTKLEATRRWDAEVIIHGRASVETQAKVKELVETRGLRLVHPYDALPIIAATGTIGFEILEQIEDVSEVYVPVSGGGLISGVAAAIKTRSPRTRVIGVEPELAADARDSLQQGAIVTWSADRVRRTIADGLRVQGLGAITWPHIKAFVDDIVTVSETEIEEAVRAVALEARLVAEPSGATSVAAALRSKSHKKVAVLSGGNIDPEEYARIMRHGPKQ